ncbi:MAG: hypothetical protein E6G42_09300 [Actinobacteria bacterium]|nr:MAG: hypothetical protein E6G42_09300 [Actinomycetota bacterium]
MRATRLPAERHAEQLREPSQEPGRRARLVPDQGTLNLPPDFPREIEALACDLDRTLLGEDGLLHARTRRAIAATRAAGIHVLLVTGRMFKATRPYALEAGLDDPVVCYQGALVAEPRSGRWLRHVPIPLESAREASATSSPGSRGSRRSSS